MQLLFSSLHIHITVVLCLYMCMYVNVCIGHTWCSLMVHDPTHIVVDEVKVVTWGNSHGGAAPLGQAGVGLVQGLMDVDKCIYDGLTMSGLLRKLWIYHREIVRTGILLGEREKGGRGRRTRKRRGRKR